MKLQITQNVPQQRTGNSPSIYIRMWHTIQKQIAMLNKCPKTLPSCWPIRAPNTNCDKQESETSVRENKYQRKQRTRTR